MLNGIYGVLDELEKEGSSKDSKFLEQHIQREADSISPGIIDEDVNIRKKVLEVIEQDSIVPVDVKVNDGDFKVASNFYTFATSNKYLNITPYVSQAIVATATFSEYCPICSNVEYLFDFYADDSFSTLEENICFLNHGVCPECGSRKSELVKNEDLPFYQEMAINAGQRSGKSALTAMMGAYLLHRFIKLQNPNSVFGLLPNSVLHGTYVALTYAQAKDTLWEPLYGYLTGSPWFQEYHSLLKYYEDRTGEELLKLNDTFAFYKHRRILFTPSGPDMRTLRGRTRFTSSCDEIGWMDNDPKNKKVKMNASEVYTALERSLLTVRSSANRLMRQGFDNIPTGMFLNISSPSGRRDKIMELVRKAQGSTKIFSLSRSTWNMNPYITKDDLSEEFRISPAKAMRDYGAEPPLAANPFIDSVDLVKSCFRKKYNPISIKYKRKKSKDGTYKRYAVLTECGSSNTPTIMALDAGVSNNSFAAVIVRFTESGRLFVEAFVEIIPLPSIPLNFTYIFDEILVPLIQEYNVRVLAADRWNSLKLLSDAEQIQSMLTFQHSVKYPAFWDFKQKMEEGSVKWPRPDEKNLNLILDHSPDEYPRLFENRPADHFFLQCLTVQDSGTSILKGENDLTDDIFRALVLVSDVIEKEEVQTILNFEGDLPAASKTMLGTMKSYRSSASRGAVAKPSLAVYRKRG